MSTLPAAHPCPQIPFRRAPIFGGIVTTLLAILLLAAVPASAAATWVVNSLSDPTDPGRTTLRAAITAAAAGDTIVFAPSLFSATEQKAITLTGGALVLTKDVTIIGPGDRAGTHEPMLALRGTTSSRILTIKSPANVSIAGLAFKNGNATGGGAVLVYAGATASFDDCDFIGNNACNDSGGALYNQGTLILDSCLVSGNRASNGGGIASTGRLDVTRSLIVGNIAACNGGGIASTNSNLSVESSTVSGNQAGTGGAITFVATGTTKRTATLVAVTVADNRANSQTGGLYVEGSAAVANVGGSIFAKNAIVNSGCAAVPHDLATQKSGKITSADYNIIIKPGTTLSPNGPHDQLGIDPKLAALADNGGRTSTYAIGTDSPALDRGNPAFAGTVFPTDQRGFPRSWPTVGRCDVGAFEYSRPLVVTLSGSDTINLQLGDTFVDPGVTLENQYAGITVTRYVDGVANGTIDTCIPGSYRVDYVVTDGMGGSITRTRTVNVTSNVALSAPATFTRAIDPALRVGPVDLASLVTVTGIPTSCASRFSISVRVEPPTGTPVMLSGLPSYGFRVGTSLVTASVVVQGAGGPVTLATVNFSVTITDPYGVMLPNVVWPHAVALQLVPSSSDGKLSIGTFLQMLARTGESRWYKFHGPPGSRIDVMLTKLPANFDLAVFGDIQKAYDSIGGLVSSADSVHQKLALLGATASPEAYSPEAYSPEAYSPEAYSPEAYSPEAYSPEAYSAAVYTPEAYSPEAYSPEAYSPEAYSPEAYSPEAYSPEAYSSAAYASAQQISLIAFSASAGNASEGVRLHTYSKTGDFYLRVRGQNGVFSVDAPFQLGVAIEQDLGAGVTDLNTTPATVVGSVPGAPKSLILWDSSRIAGTATEKTALAGSLASFATAAGAAVFDVASDARIVALNAQADANPYTPLAKNLVAETIRNVIRQYRAAAPSIADITLVGNDDVIPFFRTDDHALLASESNYFPPVLDGTHSQSSLRYAQVLSQDRYGSSYQVALGTGPYDLPELPVGRLVETAAEVKAYLDAYAGLFNGTATAGVLPAPTTAFVSGYDFLADSAAAVRDQFTAGLGVGGSVDALISPIGQAPALGWTADQFRAVFLGRRHDFAYLGGHFSAAGALAADFTTRIKAADITASNVDLRYALILSAGCHSGYNTVDKDSVALVTEKPDWAQAFSRKFALWVSGTGYQYGDTDFIEYTERLQLNLAQALRTGTGPVPVGQALVAAKRRYLQETPVVRGIHEKSLLELSLYGLPMVKVNMPGARLAPSTGGSGVAAVTPVSGAGTSHGLKAGDLTVNPSLTRVDKPLTGLGSAGSIVASYFSGPDGEVALPGTPVRPLQKLNLSRPGDGFVRGVGFRSGSYTDLGGFIPYTAAPATETRGVHGAFFTSVFYPIHPWALNQVGEVTGGVTNLNLFATQFLSDDGGVLTGTLRKFTQMGFTVYYCSEVSPVALANAPAINSVASSIGATDITFSVEAAAAVGAGVQEVWVTYTGTPGSPFYGAWRSLTLNAPLDPTGAGTWVGTLPLGGADPSQVYFFVQAVNGVGVVGANTNFGRYFRLGASTLQVSSTSASPTSLAFVGDVPTTGIYRSAVPLQAKLTDNLGQPLAGKVLHFGLGSLVKTATTGADGIASATITAVITPDVYPLEVTFAGDADHQESSANQDFVVTKSPTTLTLESTVASASSPITVTLRATDGTPLTQRSVVFLLNDGTTTTSYIETTDGIGRARLSAYVAPGTYQVAAYFAQPVTLPDGSVVSLTDSLYGPAQVTGTVKQVGGLLFSNEKALVIYTDWSAPGAKLLDRGVSKLKIRGTLASSDSAFVATGLLASPTAKQVGAKLNVQLSGKTVASGPITLAVSCDDDVHWRGKTTLPGGAVAQILIDWDRRLKTASYRICILVPPGSGPLYSQTPAQLKYELVLGAGTGEKPAAGSSVIGDAKQPWTTQNPAVRSRWMPLDWDGDD